MSTVQNLRDAGFTVRPSADAVQCTEVLSTLPFWYFSNAFGSDDVMDRIQKSRSHLGMYQLISAGEHDDDDEFPFTILSEEQFLNIESLHEEILNAEKFKTDCMEQFRHAINNAVHA